MFIDLHFPEMPSFSYLTAIPLNDSNLVSLPTPSHSQLDPFPPALFSFVIKEQWTDIAIPWSSKSLAGACLKTPHSPRSCHSLETLLFAFLPERESRPRSPPPETGGRVYATGAHQFQNGTPSESALGTQHTAINIGEFEILEDPWRVGKTEFPFAFNQSPRTQI